MSLETCFCTALKRFPLLQEGAGGGPPPGRIVPFAQRRGRGAQETDIRTQGMPGHAIPPVGAFRETLLRPPQSPSRGAEHHSASQKTCPGLEPGSHQSQFKTRRPLIVSHQCWFKSLNTGKRIEVFVVTDDFVYVVALHVGDGDSVFEVERC